MSPIEFGKTVIQMGRNFAESPSDFVGKDGLGATKRAISSRIPKLRPVLDKASGEQPKEGDFTGSQAIRDIFVPSQEVKALKQHSSNLAPGEHNAYGGSFDFSA